MKVFFSVLLCVGIFSGAFAQTVFTSTDYPETGSIFPKITYLNNPGDSPAFVQDYYIEGSWEFHTVDSFSQYLVDTVYFKEPQAYDTAGNFTGATHLRQYNNQDIFIEKDDAAALALGFGGDMFGTGMSIPIAGSTPLKMMEFPTTTGTSFSDDTYGERVMPVSALEPIIPPDYYDDFASSFDSVKIMLSMEVESDIADEPQVSVNLPSAFGGNYTCLEEHNRLITNINVYGRFILTSSWVPLGDYLPMELPYIDTTHSINLWNPAFATPFVEMETTAEHDTLHSVKFNHNGQSGFAHHQPGTFEVYPNPAKQKVSVNLDNLEQSAKAIHISNVSGKIIKKMAVNSNFIIFAADDFTAGWYVISVLNKNSNIIARQKLLIMN